MKYFILLFTCFYAFGLQAQNFEWIKSAGDLERDAGRTICTDNNGNVIMGGYFSGRMTFGTETYFGRGLDDIYIAKYDEAGNVLWVKTAGGFGNDAAYGVATDAAGNVFVTGYFDSIAYFDNQLITGNGSSDIFLVKYNAEGNLLWVKNAGGLELDEAQDVAVDKSGDVYITGRFSRFAAFGGTVITAKGNTDIFAAKYNGNGNLQWVKRAGGTQEDIAFGIATDNQRSCYITGYFKNLSDFGEFDLYTPSISTEIFVAKIDSLSEWEWATQAGGLVGDAAFDIAIDAQRNTYITGYYADEATFGGTTLVCEGYNDIFVAKLNAKGLCLWARSAGGLNLDLGSGIAVANDGSVFVCGSIDSFSYFGQSTTIGSKLQTDMFVAKWDNNGLFNWVLWAGGPNFQFALAIALGSNKSIYTTGYYYSQIQSPDSIINIFQQQDADVFLCKIFDPVLSINDDRNKKFFSSYPNPLKNEWNFTIEKNEAIEGIYFYDMQGKKQELTAEKLTDNHWKANTAFLSRQLYVYQIMLKNGETIQGKIIKE